MSSPPLQTTTDLQGLADEQAALRRVAELVAVGASQRTVFDAVTAEACHLLGGRFAALLRYEPQGPAVIVAMSGADVVEHLLDVGMRVSTDDDGIVQRVRHLRRAVRFGTYRAVPGSNAATARQLGLTSGAGAPILIDGRLWGVITVLGSGRPLPDSAEARLGMFAELAATAVANAQARKELEELADEQAALRRVAELAAQEAPAEKVLEAVAVEASRLAGVDFTTVLRFEPDGSTLIVALDGAPGDVAVGMRAPGNGDGATQRVWRTGSAARMDDLGEATGHWPQVAHGFGYAASAAVPIRLERRLWGVVVVVARREPLPRSIETPLADFAELASAAIAAAQARRELRVLAAEQSALRHVAEVVARGTALEEVFATVANEASTLLGNLATALLRYESEDTAVAIAVCNSPAPLGLLVPSGRDTATGQVLRTGRPIRVDNFADTPLAELATELGVGAGVAVPVAVEGRVWGALTTSTPDAPLPVGTEERLMQFAELAAAAIANAENKAKLTASRARVIATADETRRRLQRDVHDGAQQRLVHTLMTLRLARESAADGHAPVELIDEAIQHAERANRELRDLVRGILPASLVRGGLRAGLESLVADVALPVDLRVTAVRVSPETETTAYFIVAEALANVVKHAHASHAVVEIELRAETLWTRVSDDGSGGADPARGTGLTGLLDRVEASDGSLTITSPPGAGTEVEVTLPVRGGSVS